MAKIMLVEDDNNLREIYGARLLAEGYQIVSAQDGEEALALAVKEKPDLIISDVMMPRISGFDMLDILRNAPETRDTKVIMMTALSQAEDKSRADKLGADRYLVKSQVTLEDVANVVHEVLGDRPETEPAVISSTPQDDQPTASPSVPTAEPAADTPIPDKEGPSIPDAIEPVQPPTEPRQTVEDIANPIVEVADEPDTSQVQSPPASPAPTSSVETLPTQVLPTPVPAPASAEVAETTPLTLATTEPVAGSEVENKDLPPIVEPSSIKVELPPAAEAAKAEDNKAEEQAPAVLPATETEETKPDFVGPSLAEALASEEEQASESKSVKQELDISSLPATPSVANGATINNVIEPTKIEVQIETESAQQTEPPTPIETVASPPTDPSVIVPTQLPPADESPAPEAPSSSSPAVGGERVIQPINDLGNTPDINELLAQEERKAAVNNPSANTIITPGQLPQAATQASARPATQKNNDELNNISL